MTPRRSTTCPMPAGRMSRRRNSGLGATFSRGAIARGNGAGGRLPRPTSMANRLWRRRRLPPRRGGGGLARAPGLDEIARRLGVLRGDQSPYLPPLRDAALEGPQAGHDDGAMGRALRADADLVGAVEAVA